MEGHIPNTVEGVESVVGEKVERVMSGTTFRVEKTNGFDVKLVEPRTGNVTWIGIENFAGFVRD